MKNILTILAIFASLTVGGWGVTGHRTIGHIATQHLSEKAKKEVARVLKKESLAIVTTWMDEIRSDHAYDHASTWHYVTIPNGETYETSKKEPKGDIIQTIERLKKELEKGGLTAKTEAAHVKMLAHLIGDIHMPLHVGNGIDKGGNDVRLKYFGKHSNLHRVWDSGIIDGKRLSYTELANSLNMLSNEEVTKIQNSTVRDWANESMILRDACYDIGEYNSIGYEYNYKHWATIQQRLLKAGLRLAGNLNEIYR